MSKRFRKIIITMVLLFLFSGISGLKAQDTLKVYNFLIEDRFLIGFIWQHRPIMDYLISKHVPANDLQMSWQTCGQRNYEKAYRFPTIGVGYYFADLGTDVLGDVHGFYGFVDIPIIRKPKFTFDYQIAHGVSYLTKPFDRKTNYFNKVIGSHLNAYFNLSIDTKLRMTNRLDWITLLGITHFSNAAAVMPNLGINVVSVGSGIRYNFGEYDKIFPDRHVPPFKKKYELIVAASGSWKQNLPSDISYYLVGSLSVNAGKIINYKRRFGLGFDFFYDQSIEGHLADNGIKEIKNYQLMRPGIHVSHDFIVHNISLVMNVGYYLYNSYKEDRSLYARAGLRYKTKKSAFFSVSLVTHYAVAQFVEFGGGFYIDRDVKD